MRYKDTKIKTSEGLIRNPDFFFSNSYDVISHIVIYCPIITCMCAMMRYQ